MNKKVVFFFLLALVFIIIGIIFINKPPEELGNNKSDKLQLRMFATTLKNIKPSSQSGIVADPPREALKKMEQYVKGLATKDGKADYKFTEFLGGTQYDHLVSLYVSATPFRWRADFSTPSVNQKNTFIQDGSKYFSCFSGSKSKECHVGSTMDIIGTPIPLTEFLNSFVDPLQLKKFIPGTSESKLATIENNVKTFINKPANCVKGTDSYGEVEFCLDQEGGMPLLISLTTKLSRYFLEATGVDSSPLPTETFSPPYPVN